MSDQPLFEPERSLLERTREPLILVACTFLGLLSACVCWGIALAVRQRRQAQDLPSTRTSWSLEQETREQQSDEEWNHRAAFHNAVLTRLST